MWNDLTGEVPASKGSMEEKKKLIEEVFANLDEWHAEQKDLDVT